MAFFRRPEHFWPAFWIAVVAALSAVIAAEHFLGRVEIGEGPRAPAKIAEARLLPAFTLPPEGQSATDTVTRPLFVPTRRLSPPVATAAATTMKKGQFVLTGVTVLPEASYVFLRDVATGKTQSVKKGSLVNGITVELVEPRRIVLRQGDETEDLPLNIQVPARVVAAPSPSGAVPPAPGAVPAPVATPSLPSAAARPGGLAPPMAAPAAAGRAAAPPAQPGSPVIGDAAPAVPASTSRRRPWINAQ